MSNVDFAIRDADGPVVYGNLTSDDANLVQIGDGKQVSLNLSPNDILSYTRYGSDLVLTLANGETIILGGFFGGGANEERELFLSENGAIQKVDLQGDGDGAYLASYDALSNGDKWSAHDELVFLDLQHVEPVVAPLVVPLIGGAGIAAVGAAAVGGAALLVGGDGGSSEPDTETNVDLGTPIETDDIVNSDEVSDGVTLTGTSEPGATIEVTIGEVTETAVTDEDGNWTVTFDPEDIPQGTYETEVTVTATDDAGNSATTTTTVQVDTETSATLSDPVEGDNVVSLTEISDGITLNGTAEQGATVAVTLGGVTHTVTVGEDGIWTVTFEADEIATGTYETNVIVTATDLAGNSASTSSTVLIDTETSTSLTTPVEGDGVVNASELSDGMTLTGTAEAGATVDVAIAGVTQTVTATGDGTWSATFGAGEIAAGTYETDVVVTATDTVGNSTTTTHTIQVDTETSLTMATPIAGDNVLNNQEVTSGITLTGTAEPGATVEVTLAGATQTVIAGSDGNWSATYSASDIAAGTYETDVSVTATDAAGNSTSTTTRVLVDTEASVSMNGPIEGDNVVNAAEAADGVTLIGTTEAGATVAVSFGALTKTVLAGQDGSWSATFTQAEIGVGEYTADVSVTATDANGNSATATSQVSVDTTTEATVEVEDLTIDATVNAQSLQGGVTLGGMAEPFAAISVEVDGVVRQTTADAQGNWSVTYEPGVLPEGTYNATAVVTATDAAGNSSTATTTFLVDTEVTNPFIESVTLSDDDVDAITLQSSDEDYAIHALSAGGSSAELNTTAVTLSADETLYNFSPDVTDGTNLVVSATDAAGNQSDTLLVLDNNATNASTVNHAAVGNFNIDAIELDYAGDSSLTLTEAQVRDLSGTTDTLTVHGGTDDTVTINGASKTGETREVEGESYDVYTLGDDGVSLVIDQDINVVL